MKHTIDHLHMEKVLDFIAANWGNLCSFVEGQEQGSTLRRAVMANLLVEGFTVTECEVLVATLEFENPEVDLEVPATGRMLHRQLLAVHKLAYAMIHKIEPDGSECFPMGSKQAKAGRLSAFIAEQRMLPAEYRLPRGMPLYKFPEDPPCSPTSEST